MNKDIYYVRADGSGLVNLTRTPQFSESTPHWSPDGQHIAYGAWDFEHLENGDQTYIMNADGSQPFVVFQCTKHCSPMGWSPDGQRLLLAAEGAVLVITLDGSVVANIPHVGGGVWSPDGQYIAVVANCPDQINSTNVCTYITNADGSGLRLLTTEPGTGLSWSPDGRWLLFSSEGLWLVRADGSQLIPLIGQDDRLYQYYAPEWAPK
ncbi:MAG: hypothetical protein KKA73_25570 [Chloroflexi bacterium]|nr:hypothetical protein [Chloroflexota bacterium]MBU1751067.1 hypothetical protein [Chloroflexota bacterium]MBU1879931.1 hypothetical protein [Chloroflexota bacterium]